MSANVSQNYYVLGQAPLDAKIVFKNKQAFIDYTLNNEFFAFNFYKGMLVYLQEEEILCIWEFAYSPIYEENEKILPNNFIYPLGTIYNGLDYSEKAFNLIEIPLNKSNLGQWDLNTNDERTLTIVVDENTISNVFVPEQITQLWPNAEKISFIDGNIQGIKFQGKQIEYFEEFSLLDWDQLTYEIWNPDLAYIQNAKMKVVMVGENIDYTQYQNRILANSFTEAKIIHEAVSAKNKNSIYFLNEEDSFDILIVDKFFVVKKASDFFAKKYAKTTDNVVATTTVGAINAGETVPVGTNIQELTELLLNKTFYPTFANPTFSLANNAGLREVGSSFSVTLTFNFNRGQILGKLDNNLWNPTMLQDYRAGIATSYLLNGVSGSNNSASFNVTTILGNNNLSGSVTYETGAQPKDSKNNNFDNPLPSGTSPIQSTSFEGIYPYFYYKSLSPITPAIMQSAIANGQATKVLASSTGTITIPFAANGEYIAVAYPSTSTTKTIWYVNALDNGEIPGGLLGVANILPCNSPTGLWNNVNFKIHVSAGLITQTNPIQLKNS